MNAWSTVTAIILAVILYIALTARPSLPPNVSDFEIRRAMKAKERWAEGGRMRQRMYPFAHALRTLIIVILIIVFNAVVSTDVGLVWSGVITVVVFLILVRLSLFTRSINGGEWLYVRMSPAIAWLYERRRYLFFVTYPSPRDRQVNIRSEAELLHVVDGASFLDGDRRDLIRSALEFTGLTVADAMSGRRSIHAVDKGEVLGPLLLDELYKTGKSAFVVTDGGLDDIIGVLKLEKLTSLDLKDTPTALKAMSPDVHSIDHEAPVTEALAYLRSSKAPFLLVKDDDRTVGLLSMDNILRCLFTD